MFDDDGASKKSAAGLDRNGEFFYSSSVRLFVSCSGGERDPKIKASERRGMSTVVLRCILWS